MNYLKKLIVWKVPVQKKEESVKRNVRQGKSVEKRRRQREKERRTEKNALEENNFITNINKII